MREIDKILLNLTEADAATRISTTTSASGILFTMGTPVRVLSLSWTEVAALVAERGHDLTDDERALLDHAARP